LAASSGVQEPPKEKNPEPSINQGIYYLYLIIILQVVFVLGLATVIMVIGKVLVTPLWVFLFGFLMIAGASSTSTAKQKAASKAPRNPRNR